MARKPLGRGLSALLGEDEIKDDAGSRHITELGTEEIVPNADQPRKRFDEAALAELAASIEANGIVQPIVVRKFSGKYQIVAGERRWRAAQRAGLHRVPVVVKDVSDEKLLELALVENIQREELNPVEEARAYRQLIDNIGLTQEQIAERVGRERTLITTSLRLLKLPDDILKLIAEEKLSAGHGRALLMTDDPATQRKIARSVISGGLSVRETERAVKRSSAEAPAKRPTSIVRDPNVRAAETKLMRHFGTNVKIVEKGRSKAGKIEIEYYNESDLGRIFELLLKDKKS